MGAIEELMTGGALRRITRWGEPVMHAPTRPVAEFDDELRTLVRDMFATMRAAQGVGLAATQVGVDLSVFVFECPDADEKIRRGAVCNPVITTPSGRDRRLESADEGCLSFPGGYQPLARPDVATCTGQDPWGDDISIEGTGLLARCLQHETDHLNGVVFGDRLSSRTYRKLKEQTDALAHLYPEDWPLTARRTSAS